MNLKKTLILAAVLGGALLYLRQVALPSRDRERAERIAFARVLPSSIEFLEITPSVDDAKPYALEQIVNPERTSGANKETWSLRGVSGAVLDKEQVAGLVASLTTLEVEGPLDERETGYDVSVFGLDKPALSVTMTERGGTRTEVAFGKKNEYLSKRYVKISGRKGIFLADEAQFAAVNKTSSDVRSKTPFSFSENDVRAVVLMSKAGRVKLEQVVVGAWKIAEPTSLPASTDSVQAFLKAIKGLRMTEFVDHAESRKTELGLDRPQVTVSLSLREGIEPREVTYTIGERTAQGAKSAIFASASSTDTAFKLQLEEVSALVKSVDDLRERKIVAYDESRIKRVSATLEDGKKVEIAVSGVSWTINGKQSDPVFMQQYLKDVSAFSAAEFPTTVPPDAFDKPMLVLDIIEDIERNQRLQVTIGAEIKGAGQEQLRLVRTSGSDTVYAVRDIEAKRVVPREEALIERPTPAPQ